MKLAAIHVTNIRRGIFVEYSTQKKAMDYTKELIQIFQKTFDMFDRDRSGTITVSEMGQVLRAAGQNLSDQEVGQIIRKVDKDQDGEISFQEFLQLMARRRNRSKQS